MHILNKNKQSQPIQDIITRYNTLGASHKMALIDCLVSTRNRFAQTVELILPNAQRPEIKKLETFLIRNIVVANDMI